MNLTPEFNWLQSSRIPDKQSGLQLIRRWLETIRYKTKPDIARYKSEPDVAGW